MPKNLARLLCCDAREQINELRQRDPVLEVLKKGCYRDAGVAKHPGATDPPHIPLDRRAFSPVQAAWLVDGSKANVKSTLTTCNYPVVGDGAGKPVEKVSTRAGARPFTAERGICLEGIAVAIEAGELLDVIDHSSRARYPSQRMLVVRLNGFVHLDAL